MRNLRMGAEPSNENQSTSTPLQTGVPGSIRSKAGFRSYHCTFMPVSQTRVRIPVLMLAQQLLVALMDIMEIFLQGETMVCSRLWVTEQPKQLGIDSAAREGVRERSAPRRRQQRMARGSILRIRGREREVWNNIQQTNSQIPSLTFCVQIRSGFICHNLNLILKKQLAPTQMDESTGSRRIINVGPYQSSLLLDSGMDLNQASHQRYDQVFDSQLSIDSKLNSQRIGAYDKNFVQTQGYKRADTEQPQRIDMHFSSTQKGAPLDKIATQGSPSRLHKDALGSTAGYQTAKTSQSPHRPLTGNQNSMRVAQDLEPIMSHKLEESVSAPNRPPQKVPGLTAFLSNEHYKRIGVFSKNEDTLFKFWKQYVSSVYRARRQEQQNRKSGYSEAINFTTSLPPQLGTSFKSKASLKNKENSTEVPASENGVASQYKKFENLYEMDVVYTVQQDLDAEKNDYKKMQMSQQFQYEQKVKKEGAERERTEIKEMVDLFYADLKDYELQLLKEKDQKQKQLKASPTKPSNWHKQQSITDSINPIESIEEEKREPKKPTITSATATVHFEQDKVKIDKEIEKEQNFILHIMYMAREEGLTNDPKQLFSLYKQQKEKARMGVVWAKGDSDAEKVILKFFQPEFFLKRLMIAFQKKKKHDSQKNISLLGFYLQLQKKIRLLNMIDKPKEEVSKIIKEYEDYQKQLLRERTSMAMEDALAHQIRDKGKLLKQVLGSDKACKLEKLQNKKGSDKERVEELAKPKDKWKRGKRLLELKKKFPHDMVLQKMIAEEFKENKVFKYPEEYDLFDDDEEYACKIRENKKIQQKELGQGKELREKFKQKDGQEQYYERQTTKSVKTKERDLEKFIIDAATKYLEQKKNRLTGKRETVRQYLSETYHSMVKLHPEACNKRFPHCTYGLNEDSSTYKKSFPSSFKRYFFKMLRSFVKTEKGLKRLRHAPPAFMIPGGRRCTMHQDTCPEDCQYTTQNKKILLASTMARRRQREPGTFRSKVWRRKDYRDAMKDILMTNSELANCTFEPEAGSMSKNIEAVLQANPNLKKEGYTEEPDPEAYFTKLGKNFESSHPEVYKLGVLKRANLKYTQGKYEEAMNILCDGFNVDSIKKRFDPNYMKRFFAESLLKKKNEREKKEAEDKQKLGGRIFLQKEAPESQKKRPEEDFENKKLLAVLRDAFDLITTIEGIRNSTQKQIKKIQNSQTQLKKKLNHFSDYKKTQTKLDVSKGEKILFRSIMCPLKDKCGKSKIPRWPTSNTKSFTKFGDDCPYAHHPNDLMFPESILTKISSNKQRIKNLEKKMNEDKPKEVFKPTGQLFDCKGCSNKSGKHIGGPCNLCRYKEMADDANKVFNDKGRKESLMRSMERREGKEVKQDRNEMSVIRKELDLDQNYTKKFGLLKKACVLRFYGRHNDSFDEIARAAKIIQDQQEVEQQKQRVVEKRWKFKLGLDDAFELPIPIEQIDPSKVDEKFLKKMDMPGISLATLKLYIEQVSPARNEEFSKHAFLNRCIEDFYLECESAIEDKQNTIKMMKKQVEKLDEEADLADNFGSSPERSPEKGTGIGGTMRSKSKKTRMCPDLLERGFCPLVRNKKTCAFAHNPIELDLIPAETKMKNLNGVIMSQSIKLKNMKPLEPWKPAKAGDIEHTHLMDMASKKKKRDDDDEEEGTKLKEKVKKSIFERENILKKPYEKE